MYQRSGMIIIIASILAVAGCTDATSLAPAAPYSSVSERRSSMQAANLTPLTLTVGESSQLTSSLSRTNGSRTRVVRVMWTSRNAAVVAVVSSTGLATALSPGSSWVISANASGFDSVQVQVASAILFAVSPAVANLTVGATSQLATNDGGIVAWSTSNSAVATVSSAGLITATGPGTARVNAASSRGATSFSEITVASSVGPVTGSLLSSPFADLPQRKVNLSYPQVTGRTLRVASGQSVQRAIDSARAGDEIVLARGVTFTESVTLPAKAMNGGWITMRGEGLTVPTGTRVKLSDFAGGARLVTSRNGESAISAALGASGYWLSGFEVSAAPAVTMSYSLLMLDAQASTAAQIPTRIVLDRMYVHGHPNLELRRCVYLGASNAQVVDSYLSECHIRGFDSQALLVSTSEGPILVRNNYLEGAGENLMIGGTPPTVAGVIPSDIEIVGNHFFKPISWKSEGWSVKNLLEIKFGQRVDVRHNYFENNWVDAQAGRAILIRSGDQDAGAPWVRTRDITFRHNIVTNVSGGLVVSADAFAPVPTFRIAVLGNLIDRIGSSELGGTSNGFFLAGALKNLDLRSNTSVYSQQVSPAGMGLLLDGEGASDIRIVDNIIDGGEYGLGRSGTSLGTPSLTAWAGSSYVFTGNVISASSGRMYPAGNLLLSSGQSVFGFSNLAGRNYTLTSQSPLIGFSATVGGARNQLDGAFRAR